MDYIDVTDHDYLQDCLDQKFDFIEWALYHWKSNVLREERGWHARDEKTKIEQNLSFLVEDDYVELSDSIIENDPDVELLPNFSGKAKSLSFSCKFKIPNIKIKGKISILNPSKEEFKSDYILQAKNIEISSAVGFTIVGDGYSDQYFIHKLNKPDVSLTYIKKDEMISLLDKVENKSAKSVIQNFILDNYLKNVFKAMQSVLLQPMYDKALCSNTVGADYSLRNKYRIHEKKQKVAFNSFVDKIVDVTNGIMKKDLLKIPIPKMYKVSKGTTRTVKGVLNQLNCLVRKKTPIILVDNDQVLLYAPVDLDNLKIEYCNGDVEKEETFKSVDTYFEMSLKKLNDKKVEINVLNCKVNGLKSLLNSDQNLIVDLQLLVFIQEKLEEYLKLAVKNTELNNFAVGPPNVEIEYDADDFIGEDSDAEEDSN